MDISKCGYLKLLKVVISYYDKWSSLNIKMKVVISQNIKTEVVISKYQNQKVVVSNYWKPEPGTQGNPKMKNGWPENPEKWSKIEKHGKHSKKMMKKLKKSKKHQKIFKIFPGRKTEKWKMRPRKSKKVVKKVEN